MKNKVNKLFSIFSSQLKNIDFTSNTNEVSFSLGWIIVMGLMYYSCRINNIVICLCGLTFAVSLLIKKDRSEIL